MPRKAPIRAARVYARVTGGSRQWWCPDCGSFNHHKAPVWEILVKIRCTYCGATFYWGSTLYRVLNSACMDTPPDVISPQFADIALRKRRKREPINDLRTLNHDGTWEECQNS